MAPANWINGIALPTSAGTISDFRASRHFPLPRTTKTLSGLPSTPKHESNGAFFATDDFFFRPGRDSLIWVVIRPSSSLASSPNIGMALRKCRAKHKNTELKRLHSRHSLLATRQFKINDTPATSVVSSSESSRYQVCNPSEHFTSNPFFQAATFAGEQGRFLL